MSWIADEWSLVRKVESEVEKQPPFRLPGVASLKTGFIFVESVNLVEVSGTRLCDEECATILARSTENHNVGR